MTQVGHMLTGVAIGILCMPGQATRPRMAAQVVAFTALANLPDTPLPGWGHDRYDISHSVFVNLLLIALAVLALWRLQRVRAVVGGWRVIGAAGLAWLSHLLLDSFYNHGLGVAIFWPFSDAHLALPIPWFSVVQGVPPPLTPEMARAFAIELVCYAPLVLAAIVARRTALSRSYFGAGPAP